MSQPVLVELFDQILTGRDIPKPVSFLRIRPDLAATRLDGLPYSILANLAHAVLWQSHWLDKLSGRPTRPVFELWREDFREPDPSEFSSLRRQWELGLVEARAIAAGEQAHRLSSDEEAAGILLQIAVHASYHIGQMKLLKRALDGTKRASEDR